MLILFASRVQDWIPALRSSCVDCAKLYLLFPYKLISVSLDVLCDRTTGVNRAVASSEC